MLRFRRFSTSVLCFVAALSCKGRSFNLSSPKTDAGLPPAQAQAVEDIVSRAFISQASSQELAMFSQKDDSANICLEAIPKLKFDPANLQADLPTLGYFSILSQLSYETPDQIKEAVKKMGFSDAVHLVDPSTSSQAYLFVHDSYLVIAFTGTKEPGDILTDIDLFTTKTLFGFGVHKGFLRAYMGDYESDATKPAVPKFEGIRTAILKALPKYGYPAKKLFITGHSLGAGLATLLAANLAVRELSSEGQNLPENCDALTGQVQGIGGVVNFASSRVGGYDFAACYQKMLGSKTLRIVNDKDFLPFLPDSRFYKHVGKRVFLDKDGNISVDVKNEDDTKSEFFEFLTTIAKGGLGGNISDHLNYYIKIAHKLEPKCPNKRK